MKNSKYYFYLNPYDDYKWTKCPKCETKTKVRKYCLMIHYKDESVDANQVLSLNKTCKFYPSCELIIAQQSELENFLTQMIQEIGLPPFKSNSYLVFGTIDRKDWKKGQDGELSSGGILEVVSPFKDHWDFEIEPAGWYFDG
ncbi:MAG: hypothetical protein AAF740_03665 [Bacteroidota bacterium]